MIGNNLQQNFGKNSLKKDQILFLHAGDSEVLEGENGQRISQLLLRSNQHLPEPEPLQIIFKKNESSSIITSLTTTSLEEIKSLIDSGDKIDLVDKIYNLITDNISEQRASVLKQLEDIPQKSKDIINAELERLGFVDFIEDDIEVKEILVKKYITRMLMTPRYFYSPDIVSNLELFLQPDLFDINSQLYYNSVTPAFMAPQEGKVEALKFLAEYGADLNKARDDGATPLMIAINSYKESKTENFKDVIILLVENGVDPKLETPFGSAYEFSSDKDLNKEMAKARKEYLEKNHPQTSAKKPKAEKVHKKYKEQEL
ncbi:MAG: ankyrin repeat domain-containing protein [Rickettsiales bacterium]|nr:ankyrin repeat domain-containing protein [Rickettsiales bacterium]